MPMLTSKEKSVLVHLAKSGDLCAQGYVDHEAEIVNLRLGKEGELLLVRFATTGAVTLATVALTVTDGVTPVAGNYVLVKNQASSLENGIYVVGATAWTRLKDINGNDLLKSGMVVSVSEGTVNADTLWTLTTNTPFVVGTDAVAFSQYVATGVSAGSLAAVGGAALVGIADAASLITGTTVETALQELVKYVPVSLADPGTGVAIGVTRSATVNIVTAGAETNTLAIPAFLGQKMILNMDTRVGGDRVVTASQAINQAGNTIMTFGAARDNIVLEAITVAGALRWSVTHNDGVALS